MSPTAARHLLTPSVESEEPTLDRLISTMQLVQPCVLAPPERLTEPDAWIGHIPFAFWLMAAHRPRTLVELGTHSGNSYSAFCQAAATLGLDLESCAVDTWQGDPQAGFYGEEVWAELSAYHDRRYAAFSRLIRARFDEARARFADGSIDLLHIDGYHTYDAVRHDFDAWQPKLSRRAVVLLHDTDVRERDFGVWRLWEETASQFPGFAFLHHHGLGVLAVGPEQGAALRAFLAAGATAAGAELLRGYFARLGRGVQAEFELRRALQEQDRLRADHAAAIEAEVRLSHALAEAEAARWQLKAELAAVLAERNELQRRLAKETRRRRKMQRSPSWRATRPFRTAGKTAHRLAQTLLGRSRKPAAGPATAEPDPELLKARLKAEAESELATFLAGGERIVLPRTDRPKVSIILVLFNQAALTLKCLRSIAATVDLPFELIVIDNASGDATGELLGRLDGAVIRRNQENLHFLLGVNQGAGLARGEHVLLLNNDAVLLPGVLRTAVATLESAEDIGAVGARLILPDGTLQEAGSIVWQDGSCLGYGRGQPPEAGPYMFRRDVDCCSGAFLLVRRPLFERLGRLDEAFKPAYYEETDLCLRLWAAGWRVVYDPQVVVHHYEFGSAASREHAVALMARNREIFIAHHQTALAAQHLPSAPDNILLARARDREQVEGRVLVIDERVPYPDLGAGYPRAAKLLETLHRAGWFVTFYPLVLPEDEWERVRTLLPPTMEVMLGCGAASLAKFLKERAGYYDHVVVSRPHDMATFMAAAQAAPGFLAGTRLIYDAEAMFSLRAIQQAKVMGRPMSPDEEQRRIEAEIALARPAACVLAVSEAEAEHFRRAGLCEVRVLGHAIEPAPGKAGFDEREHLLFVGRLRDDNSPNVDSILWFVHEVLPILHRRLGRRVMLKIAGRHGAEQLRHLTGDPAVEFLGPVADLAPLYDACRLFVAPTRFAAGIPHKVHEAAAHGLPVVTTSLIAGQLGWHDGQELLVADDAEGFAAACCRLYAEPDLWSALRARALARVAQDCAPDKFAATALSVLAQAPRPARNALASLSRQTSLLLSELASALAYAEPEPFVIKPLPEDSRPGRICCLVHIYYPELWPELLRYLGNLRQLDHDILINLVEGRVGDALRSAIAAQLPKARMLVSPNEGRDIGGFFRLMQGVDFAAYDSFLLLHTKRSPHLSEAVGAAWRRALIDPLIGSPAIARLNLELLTADRQVGMIGSALCRSKFPGENAETITLLAERLGIAPPYRQSAFVGGTMSFVRASLMQELYEGLRSLEFLQGDQRPLSFHVDGRIEHAVERIFGALTAARGYRIAWRDVRVTTVSLDLDLPGQSFPVRQG